MQEEGGEESNEKRGERGKVPRHFYDDRCRMCAYAHAEFDRCPRSLTLPERYSARLFARLGWRTTNQNRRTNSDLSNTLCSSFVYLFNFTSPTFTSAPFARTRSIESGTSWTTIRENEESITSKSGLLLRCNCLQGVWKIGIELQVKKQGRKEVDLIVSFGVVRRVFVTLRHWFLTFLKSGNTFDYVKNLRNTKINPKNKQKHPT